MPIGGATGAVLKRSLDSLGLLITRALNGVRNGAQARQTFSVAALIADAEVVATLDARATGCTLTVPQVDPALAACADRELLLGALRNLLQNAFKFTHPRTEVTLNAYELGKHVLIEVKDHCGGLPPGSAEDMFSPFTQRGNDRSGLGLGLSIARQSVEADYGTLSVRDVPGTGCVFTIGLPRHAVQ